MERDEAQLVLLNVALFIVGLIVVMIGENFTP
jgi:hypothetical protein